MVAYPYPVIPQVVALADAATIAVNAALGNDFRVTIAGSRTMGAPSNPADGQVITFVITQDVSGSRIITWTSSAGGYDFGTTGAPTLSTSGGAIDAVGFKYDAAKGIWICLGFQLGF